MEKNIKKTAVQILSCVLIVTGLYYFCEHQTRGFRYYQLLSNIPNDPRWETTPLCSSEKEQIDAQLNQTFTFLGKGGFCTAFLGEDQKTVLKFYNHHFLSLSSLFSHFSWEKLLLKGPNTPTAFSPYLEFAFKSCQLLYAKAKEKTGLLYIHLNKSHDLLPSVSLIDPIGVRHTIDLNKTEFVLQQRAQPVIDYIAHAVKVNKPDLAKNAIAQYLHCLLSFCQMGIKDQDSSFRSNYGILDNAEAVAIDISSFTEDPRMQQRGYYRKEIVLKSHNLAKWLKKHHPDLFVYYDQKLTDLLEND